MPKRSRSGLVKKPCARGGADQGEFGELDLDRARRRPLADDEVELKILHRGIEHLLHRRAEAMDFVDEQHVALFEIGQQRREIAGLGDHRTRSGAEADAEFARHDLRQRGLAEAGRADEQHVVERLAALARGLDEDREIVARLRLADELGQQLRAQRGVADIVGAALGRDDAGGRWSLCTACTCSRQQFDDAHGFRRPAVVGDDDPRVGVESMSATVPRPTIRHRELAGDWPTMRRARTSRSCRPHRLLTHGEDGFDAVVAGFGDGSTDARSLRHRPRSDRYRRRYSRPVTVRPSRVRLASAELLPVAAIALADGFRG